jgi:hypothetical protein
VIVLKLIALETAWKSINWQGSDLDAWVSSSRELTSGCRASGRLQSDDGRV